MKLTNEIDYFYYRMAIYELQFMNKKDYYNGLSYNSLLYLNVIYQIKDCTISKLSEILKITKSAATLKVNELVKQGAVTKIQSDEDKRVYYIRLSDSMKDNFQIYDKIFEKIEYKLSEKYKKEHLDLFCEILHSISEYEWGE